MILKSFTTLGSGEHPVSERGGGELRQDRLQALARTTLQRKGRLKQRILIERERSLQLTLYQLVQMNCS